MSAYIDQVSSLSPKVWYRLNETSGAPTNYGSLSTSSTFANITLDQSTDVDGRSVYFNGSTSSIKLPNWSAFSLFDDRSFTTEMWFKIDYADTLTASNPGTTDDRYRPLFTFITQNGAQGSIDAQIGTTFTQAQGTGNRGRLVVTNYIGTFKQYISTETYADSTWHHLVVANNTTAFKVYVDGVLKYNQTISSSPTSIDMDNDTVRPNSGKLIGARADEQGTDTIQTLSRFKGYIDEVAIYDYELTSTQVTNNFVAGTSVTVVDTVGTASALSVQPSLITQAILAASPATASATADGHYQTDIDMPTLLETYMQSLGTAGYLEQWWKFDQYKVISNYGNGGNSGMGLFGDATNAIQGGVQGSGCIGYTGSINDGYVAGSNPVGMPAFNTELSDGNYVMGLWTYIPSSITSSRSIFAGSDTTGRYIGLSYAGSGTGSMNALVNSSGGLHTVAGSTVVNDNKWHFIAIKFSGTTLQLFIDGTSQGTVTVNGTLPGTITSFGFGTNNVSAYGGNKLLVSQFFIGNTTNITTTVIANIYNAGKDQVQASAQMVMPAFKDDNAFNTYILGLDPYFYYKLDETSGTPQSIAQPMALLLEGSNATQNITTKNKKGLRITNRDTVFGNLWTAPAGTFSTNNRQSFAVYAKPVSGSNANLIASTGAANASGSGIGLSFIVNAAGQTLLRVFTTYSASELITNTNTNVTDGNYHLFVGVKDGGTLKLYIDGKLTNSQSSASTFTDNGQFLLGGNGANALSNLSRDVTIDEVAMFALALTDTQVFEMWRSLTETMDTIATASLPMPAYQAGTGRTITANVSTASAALPNVFPFVSPLTANGLFQMPNFAATKTVSATANAMTASGVFHMPQYSIGEINSVDPMYGSAMMGNSRALIPGFWNANPGIAQAAMVQPALSTTLGALVRAQSLNANAFAPIPPQYFTIADDLWYQRLVAIDQKDTVGNSSIVFFNTSSNFYVPSDPIPGSGWTATAAINGVTSPLPAINGGYFDAQNRKAVNLRNIGITSGYTSGNLGVGDRDFTFEVMIKTTKSNQILFVGENENTYNFQRTGVILRNGKLALTYSKDRRSGSVSANDQYLAFIGNKNIADGQWHHLIIQNRQTGVDFTQPRIQFWIDGELDIQRYGNEMYVINRIGYNSSELNSYSDFSISAFGLGLSAMVEENEINLNYLAAINVVPVKAGVATASATATPNNKGRGNRGRALMLYFWPTQNSTIGYYSPTSSSGSRSGVVGNNYHDYDQGGYGNDPDTFYQLTTYLNQGASQFYDWDIWPVPVVKLFEGDKWVGESHPILKDGITKGGTDKGTVYVDPVTDNERYLNLMTDFKDLSQFDMICFRNYPDQSGEQDKFGVNAKGVVDEYFNLLDKNLFADFLKSLRDAVDTGISLFITNPQLAVDMGFIDTYHTVSDLTDSGNEGLSDPYVPVKLNDPLGTGTPQLSINYPTSLIDDGNDVYEDAYRNNYHQVVNTLEDLTDDAAFIWTDEIKYSTDGSEFGELDRWWSHVEYNNGLQVGNRFLLSTAPTLNQSYFATPLDAVRAGKVITKFADTYIYGAVERVNPYRNYATSIAVEPGTVVAGKQIGAKVFISFTDVVGIQQGYRSGLGGYGQSIEQKQVSLTTDYWIDYAFSLGLLTVEERNDLLLESYDRRPDSAAKNAMKYWTLNGQDIIGTLSPYDDNTELTTDTSEQAKKQKVLKRTRRGKTKGKIGAGALPNFMILWGWSKRQISVPVPSINTRALWWLSDRLEYTGGLPQRPVAFEADAFMKQPVVTGYKTATVNAQPGLAVGAMIETNLRSAGTTIAVLPLTATALFVEKGTLVPATPATANATLPQDIRTTTLESDQVVLYLVHVDPILYFREDVIK